MDLEKRTLVVHIGCLTTLTQKRNEILLRSAASRQYEDMQPIAICVLRLRQDDAVGGQLSALRDNTQSEST